MSTIRTKDIKEAAYYFTDGRFRMADTEISTNYGKKVVWFTFETEIDDETLQRLRTDFRTGNCRVEPVAYAGRLADIKAIIREKCYDF